MKVVNFSSSPTPFKGKLPVPSDTIDELMEENEETPACVEIRGSLLNKLALVNQPNPEIA